MKKYYEDNIDSSFIWRNALNSDNIPLLSQSEALKHFLKKDKMTQKELSLRTNLSEKHISEIINGKKKISEKVSIKLHYIFGTEKFYFSRLHFYE